MTESQEHGRSATEPAVQWLRPEWLGRLEAVAKILSLLAVPLILALGGWVVQRQLQSQTVSKDYVSLAVSILRGSDSTPDLRQWAVHLLNNYSPVQLGSEISAKLSSGETSLPGLETFSAVPSSPLSEQLNSNLKPALTKFQAYLYDVGFNVGRGDVKYEIVPGGIITIANARYYAVYDARDPTNLVLMVAAEHVAEFDLIRHEYMRHVLDLGLVVPRVAQGDPRRWEYDAIDAGLAVYFACSFRGDPVFSPADSATRIDLNNRTRYQRDSSTVPAADEVGDQVWAAAFWEMRQSLRDPKEADRLLSAAWMAWQPMGSAPSTLFRNFVQLLVEVDKVRYGGQDDSEINEIFGRRGLLTSNGE